tara:strand:+ start:2328 stop:2840 length:513 start_codon:yes stop_codon:yes gene_type:complete
MKKLLISSLLVVIINIHADNNSSILEWTTKNTLETFNYNALNFKEKLSSIQPKFTDLGWKRYKQALNSSGNIDYVVEHNLIVRGEANGEPTIKKLIEKDNTKEKWEVTMPAIVLYLNEYFTVTQEITTYVTVERIPESNKYAISDINSNLNKPMTVITSTPVKPSSCQTF